MPVTEKPKAILSLWWLTAILVMALLTEGGLWLASGLRSAQCFELGSCLVGFERTGRWGLGSRPVYKTWIDRERSTEEVGRRIELGFVDIEILLVPTTSTSTRMGR
jgi:hypothetical protein